MRVSSNLANLDIRIGRISRKGDELVVESAPESSLDVRIRVDASDARNMLGTVLKSTALWGFLFQLLFSPVRRQAQASREGRRPALRNGVDALAARSPDNPAWRARRERTGLNKPW